MTRKQAGKIMKKFNIFDIEGMEFPAGRRTRVMYGENGAVNGEYHGIRYHCVSCDGLCFQVYRLPQGREVEEKPE